MPTQRVANLGDRSDLDFECIRAALKASHAANSEDCGAASLTPSPPCPSLSTGFCPRTIRENALALDTSSRPDFACPWANQRVLVSVSQGTS